MNLLIIGGLLVVAAAAIIGAVLIVLSEQRAETTRNGSLKQPTSTASSDLTTRQLTTTLGPNLPATRETNLPSREEDQRLSSLNGQFHELAGEIRTLHQQASQLEQRLSILTEMVDHIERTQGDRISIEEETAPKSDNTLA